MNTSSHQTISVPEKAKTKLPKKEAFFERFISFKKKYMNVPARMG